MKTISPSLLTHIQGEVTTLAQCWKIVRTDGTVFRFTTHDSDLVVSGDTYSAMDGFSPSALASDSSMAVDNMTVTGFFDDSSITNDDLKAGRFDYADVRLFAVNWADTTMGTLKLRRGWLGECVSTPEGYFKTELRGLMQALQQKIGNFYSAICRADLGDDLCKIPIRPDLRENVQAYVRGQYVRAATDTGATGQAMFENRIYKCVTAGTTDTVMPTFDTTVGNNTTDGTVVWQAVEAWTRDFVVSEVTDTQNFKITVTDARAVDGWFADGVITFDTGDNAGVSFEVKSWEATEGAIVLHLFTGFPIQVGDLGGIYPGCDKTKTMCIGRFANMLNRRAEDYIPGTDKTLTYPNSDGSIPGGSG